MTVRGRPFYYGWVIVAAFFVLNAAGQASGTLNFGFFVIPMAEELGLSRQAIGWAQTMRLWASGLSGILIGRWLDRHGPRGPMLLAIVVATGGLLLLARAESPAVLFGVLLGLGITGWTAPAGGALIATVPVSKWFIRLRGRATGIVQLGLGVGGALFVSLTQVLISNHGWRSAWVTLAWLSAATVPLVLLLRRQPSDMGLEPDGGPPSRTGRAHADRAFATGPHDSSESVQWTLRAAIRTATLWKLSAAFAILGFLLGAASVHRIPHWIELGFHPTTVSLAFAMDAGVATVMALVAGFVVERLDARMVGLVSCLSFCVGVALMAAAQLWAAGPWTPVLFASTVTFGCGVGTYMVVQGVIWAQYYGWQFVGTIRGVVLPFIFLASGLGAPLAGALRDASGNYRGSWLLVSALAVVAAGLILSARRPRTPQSGGDG
ncbi:MAG: MFS transporter [Spirochaetaceae bacterium]|nr:MFS transporter [Spirochaetaceae bacterium]